MKTGEIIKIHMFEKEGKDQNRKSEENLILKLTVVTYCFYITNIHITIKRKLKSELGMDHQTDKNAKIGIPGEVITAPTDEGHPHHRQVNRQENWCAE